MGPGWAKKSEIFDRSGVGQKSDIFDGPGWAKKSDIFYGSGVGKKI
jgi:hypothetical protein